jgi:hypothetical protein
MTQQSPTGRPDAPPPGGAPVPPSGWAPAPLSDGERPRFGAEPAEAPGASGPLSGRNPPGVTIEEFAPPRSRLPLVVLLIAVVVAGLIWAGTTMGPAQPIPAATVSASPRPSASANPTTAATGAGLPFVSPDQRYSGRWEILAHQWTDSGLEVEIRIAVDQGPIGYSFIAFGNNDTEATRAEPGSQFPRFSGSVIPSGQEETGWLFFPLQRGASTIILANGAGNQMSALPVAG